MSDTCYMVFPTLSRLTSVVTNIECLLDLFDGKNQPAPALVVVTIAEPNLNTLPEEFRSRLMNGNQFPWVTSNTEAWIRRSECLRLIESDLNPNYYPFGSLQRKGRLILQAVGWTDAIGCPHAFRDLFEVHDELIRLHGLEMMPETGRIRDPAYPVLEHLHFNKRVVICDLETGEETIGTELDPNPLPPFDATSTPPPITFWVRDQLQTALARLRQVLERGSIPPPNGIVSSEGGSQKSLPKPKRSTERGEGRVKLIAALTKHHKYAEGSCLNQEPINNNVLAKMANVSKSTASAFFEEQFKGYDKYKVLCKNLGGLLASLKLLNDDFPPHELYGNHPPNEANREDE